MKNKYGNYVIFKALTTSEMEDKEKIMESLVKCINSINVTKYRNRWMSFVEENPLKIPNISVNQVMKPSLFKASSGNYTENQDSFNKKIDNSTTDTSDSWESMRQHAGPEQHSQFYYQNSNQQQINQMNQMQQQLQMQQMQQMNQMNQMNPMMNVNMNPNYMMNMGGQQNPGYGFYPNQGTMMSGGGNNTNSNPNNINKKNNTNTNTNSNNTKNYNQKFYQEKNQHHVKGGHNNLGF